MSEQQEDVATKGVGWYVSDTHIRRAIGYLSGALPELHAVEVPRLAAAFAEALERTMEADDPSPIGPRCPRIHRERAEVNVEPVGTHDYIGCRKSTTNVVLPADCRKRSVRPSTGSEE